MYLFLFDHLKEQAIKTLLSSCSQVLNNVNALAEFLGL